MGRVPTFRSAPRSSSRPPVRADRSDRARSGPRRAKPLLATAIGLSIALAAAGCSGSDRTTASPKTELVTAATSPAGFHAFGSIGQASVTDAPPGDQLQLVDHRGHVVASGRADRLGSRVFYGVTPATGYHVQDSRGATSHATPEFEVPSRDETPSPESYASRTLVEGLNYVPMRDGVELAMTLRLPAGKHLSDGPFPTVIEYSGYEVAAPHDLLADVTGRIADPSKPSDPLVPSTATVIGSLIAPLLGFATVSVQIRGSGCSGGAYDLFGLPTIYDGYDAVETVAAQPWVHAHKVGMVGISYSGFSQLFVGGTRPPHLAALAPMSATDDLYDGIGSPGGIFNNGFAKGWLTERQHDAKAAPAGGQDWAKELVKEGDQHCIANQKLHGQAQDGLGILEHAEFRDPALYRDRTPGDWAKQIDVPTFLVGGMHDEQLSSHWADVIPALSGDPDVWVTMFNGNHNDALQPAVLTRWVEFLEIFVADEVPKVPPLVLQLSPLLYQQMAQAPAPALPQTRFASLTDPAAAKAEFRKDPRVRVLLDVGAGSLGGGALEPVGEAHYDTWPPATAEPTSFYLGDHGKLTATAPTGSTSAHYLADPKARPSMNLAEDDHGKVNDASPPYDWKPVATGKGLGYETDALSADLVLAGPSSLDLYVSATAKDTDLQATLSEVRADGKEMYLGTGWMRASHRKLETSSTALQPKPTHLQRDASSLSASEPSLVRIPIFPTYAQLRAGSRLRVTIQAPGGDRPLWTFRTIDTGTTKVTVEQSAAHPSKLVIPVVAGATAATPAFTCGVLRGEPCRDFTAASNGG